MSSPGTTATVPSPENGPRRSEDIGTRVGEVLANRFLLRHILGHGSTGTVFAALDGQVGQRVAIKVLHPDLQDERTNERLRREVRAARTGHANLVAVYDLHETDGRVFLSMELVEGQSLKELLAERRRLNFDEVLATGRQIASALEHLGSRGIVHRDVKPGNILLTPDGTAKLCDMGLARPVEQGITVTMNETVVGTPAYMAPEQGRGAELTPASDVYGLGLTLYECLTGTVPLTSETAVATLTRRQREHPPPVRRTRADCPRWISRLLGRMLEPDPRDRPSAAAVVRALRSESVLPRPRRSTALAAASVVLVACALLGLSAIMQRTDTSRIDITSDAISGRDERGKVTWRRELKIPVAENLSVDLDGDGSEEIVIVQQQGDGTRSRAINEPGPIITVLERDGVERLRFLPEENLTWTFPYDIELVSSASAIDIDHDGTGELAILSRHCNYYPTVLHIFWPLQRVVDLVLVHPGRIYDVAAVPPEVGPGIRLLGVNNRYGMLGFVGEIGVRGSRAPGGHRLVSRPVPAPGHDARDDRYHWKAYVPIDSKSRDDYLNTARVGTPSNGPDGSEFGGAEVWFGNHLIESYDRFWNPAGTSTRDLVQLRLSFMSSLEQLDQNHLPDSVDGISKVKRDIEVDHAALLTEPPYRFLLDITVAGALARNGALSAAISELEKTPGTINHGEVLYRLANLHAIAGNLAEAQQLLRDRVLRRDLGPRVSFDAPHLLLRLGIQLPDRSVADQAIIGLSRDVGSNIKTGVTAAHQARVRLWWDEPMMEDETVSSWAYAPAGEAIACLARWRRGSSRPEDIAAMTDGAKRNPDAASEYALASAAVMIAAGKPRNAVESLNELIFGLRVRANESFADHQSLQLALALRTVALSRSGESERAAQEARGLAGELDPRLLPGKLVREVLNPAEP